MTVLRQYNTGTSTWDPIVSGVQGPTAFRNVLINGAFNVDQRNNGGSITPTNGTPMVTDRWRMELSQASKYTVGQNYNGLTPPAGFSKYFGIKCISSWSPGSGDYATFEQIVEGLNWAQMSWGTSSAKTVTLSFWVNASTNGTFTGAIRNAAANRSYAFNYTINTINTWEQKTITIAGDTTGTWPTDNGSSLILDFALVYGLTYQTSTVGAWQSGNYIASSSGLWISASNATWNITGVQIEVGSSATAFDYRSYGTELALCQRYYYRQLGPSYAAYGIGVSFSGNGYFYMPYRFPVTMRTGPTMNYSSLSDFLFYASGANPSPTSLTLWTTGTNTKDTTTLTLNVGYGSAGTAGWLTCNGTNAGWMDFDCEM
jgi:hypothetical protein